MSREQIHPDTLRLPRCPIPRPDDSVSWFNSGTRIHGTLIGHAPMGEPIVLNEFGGSSVLTSFEPLRLAKPFEGIGPSWSRLPRSALIVRPHSREQRAFQEILSQRTPPGPQYSDLIYEIWARGFEIFLVGGTVRDVLANHPTKDVDLVTTLPLAHALPLITSMYRYPDRLDGTAARFGHVRVGGRPKTADPFIDLCVFKHSQIGTDHAILGATFDRDVGYRDFACNSVYYDPINDVLIDPTGRGISDAEHRPSCHML